MKKIYILLHFCLIAVIMTAQDLRSPDGDLEMSFSVDQQGTPVYTLNYKGKTVINPSKLGLELIGSDKVEFGAEINREKDPQTSLYDGFSVSDVQNST